MSLARLPALPLVFSAGTKGTNSVVVFAALVLEKTGEWEGSSHVPTPQKSTLPEDLCDLNLSISSAFFLASAYSSLMSLLREIGICVRVYSLSHD